MRTLTVVLTVSLLAFGPLPAQGQQTDNESEQPTATSARSAEPITGTRIRRLPKIKVGTTTFGTAPIILPAESAETNPPTKPESDQQHEAEPRPSITFILGENDSPDNAVYEIARDVFASDASYRTDFLVSDLRSLTQVRERLSILDPEQRWGTVNIVVHGSAQTGIKAPIDAGGAIASSPMLAHWLRNQGENLKPLASLDTNSAIRLYSCGLGGSPELLRQVASFFAGPGPQPKVQAMTKVFEFRNDEDAGVYLREALISIAPTRHLGRREVAQSAAKLGVDLEHRWEKRLQSEPLIVQFSAAEISEADQANPEALAQANHAVQSQLQSMEADTDDFQWDLLNEKSGTVVRGKAIISSLTLGDEAGTPIAMLDPDQGNWISSR